MSSTVSKQEIIDLVISLLTKDEIENLEIRLNGVYTFENQMNDAFDGLTSIHGLEKAEEEIKNAISFFRSSASALSGKGDYIVRGFKLIDSLVRTLFKKNFERKIKK
ncbi:hypothetical protein [Candidatus Mycoplasma haematohominis]|uniref:Uncharacterized protein n=1 Tax=Candidatus Mycoplasma haematohominis TaxID=1494318 RepID=A0A478FP76_9MOLU|nr:hypothetical protein [Candidatus Mycoplasma haemohominis]GCE63148.1 hypothetical protein MHSWG343_01260 [Candidatus Mycoplasma haemohominis]